MEGDRRQRKPERYKRHGYAWKKRMERKRRGKGKEEKFQDGGKRHIFFKYKLIIAKFIVA